MKPSPDEPQEAEPPMTRAFQPDDEDAPSNFGPGDSEGTLEDDTRRMEQSSGASALGSGPGGSSFGSWTGGTSLRGVSGRIAPGQVLYSKYHVIRKLGGGAMGDVWLVRHVAMDDLHALKLIVSNIASNDVALRRFQREFKVMASLKHHHAVQIYDAAIDDDGGYIDMEYVDGRTIHEILASARTSPDYDPSKPLMPLGWIVRFLDQLTDVLQEAHEKGIVHRDLKPSNLMLLDGRKPGRESLKVLDFGIAKIRDDPDNAANMTLTQGFIGTPSYGSPEQAMNRQDLDGRSDIYSVGVILYEMVTGKLPFKGVHFQVMHQHASVPPPPFHEANPELRPLPELEHAIFRSLSKDRDQRQQTARELFDEVLEAIEAIQGPTGTAPPDSAWALPRKPPSAASFADLKTEHDSGSPSFATGPQTLTSHPTHPTSAKTPADSPSTFGGEVQTSGPPRAFLIGSAILGLALLILLFVYFRPPVVEKRSDRDKVELPPPIRPVALPEGYSAPKPVLKDQAGYPERLIRESDDVEFSRFAPGIYLPRGYTPVDPKDLVDGWPRLITRDNDPTYTRLVRIEGNRDWTMGAWDATDATGPQAQNDTPAHRVLLRSGFYIQETEVTNAQFEAFLELTSRVGPSGWDQARQRIGGAEAASHPAVQIPRKMAIAYARYASGMLPTEAQWEYAARSRGMLKRFVWGDSPYPSRDVARIDAADSLSTFPVGSFSKTDITEEGLLDMLGNVKEMCRDAWKPYQKRDVVQVDPCEVAEDSSGVEYVIRGGDFNEIPDNCKTTNRDTKRRDEECAAGNIGFRLVVECPDARPPSR
ncbi:bifunctional serine/threonine-protein kinase/formylglycine-generating enzyme family protein [Tundrisphaera lichenicola]|uniref:bifunctional serine/threonine-protein kinase/formylglycine-generating enzyme family protein n=1 Tax=Tundrisphaera lichenicola TaxID=2029860 RepID=UPI003EBDF95F